MMKKKKSFFLKRNNNTTISSSCCDTNVKPKFSLNIENTGASTCCTSAPIKEESTKSKMEKNYG